MVMAFRPELTGNENWTDAAGATTGAGAAGVTVDGDSVGAEAGSFTLGVVTVGTEGGNAGAAGGRAGGAAGVMLAASAWLTGVASRIAARTHAFARSVMIATPPFRKIRRPL
jgi:hypothetical protein